MGARTPTLGHRRSDTGARTPALGHRRSGTGARTWALGHRHGRPGIERLTNPRSHSAKFLARTKPNQSIIIWPRLLQRNKVKPSSLGHVSIKGTKPSPIFLWPCIYQEQEPNPNSTLFQLHKGGSKDFKKMPKLKTQSSKEKRIKGKEGRSKKKSREGKGVNTFGKSLTLKFVKNKP
ncbi:unnamed protein product [Cochlearia groenlandica]